MTKKEIEARIAAARTAGYLSGFAAGSAHAKKDIESIGYKIVPVELTEAMSDAGAIHPKDYAAMLAAAPKVTP